MRQTIWEGALRKWKVRFSLQIRSFPKKSHEWKKLLLFAPKRINTIYNSTVMQQVNLGPKSFLKMWDHIIAKLMKKMQSDLALGVMFNAVLCTHCLQTKNPKKQLTSSDNFTCILLHWKHALAGDWPQKELLSVSVPDLFKETVYIFQMSRTFNAVFIIVQNLWLHAISQKYYLTQNKVWLYSDIFEEA